MAAAPQDVTQLLVAWRKGDEAARDQVMALIYNELRRIAAGYLRGERPGHTLQTAALVNEAYLRLAACEEVEWQNRAHFYGAAAQAMRRILVDHARTRNYAKRGGGAEQVALDEALQMAEERAAEMIALDDALADLAKLDPRKSRVVELRYFGGLSVEETAEALGIAPVTVMRDWNTARAWLLRAMSRTSESKPHDA